jgi:hypothetical protein
LGGLTNCQRAAMRPSVAKPGEGRVEQAGTLGIGARHPGDESDHAGYLVRPVGGFGATGSATLSEACRKWFRFST